MTVHFGGSGAVFYLCGDELQHFSNVKLIADDQKTFHVNSLLLASHSSLLKAALSGLDADDFAIITEIPSNQLEVISKFVCSGEILDVVDADSLEFKSLAEAFRCLGIDLDRLRLTKEAITKEKEELDDEDASFQDFPNFLFDEETFKPKRGRPKKSEGPRKKLRPKPERPNKLLQPPFADECEDLDSMLPKNYRGRNLRFKKKVKNESATSEGPNTPDSSVAEPRKLRERKLTKVEYEDLDDTDDEPAVKVRVIDHEFEIDVNGEDDADDDDKVYSYKPGVRNDLTPKRRVPKRRQGPRASILFYFPQEGERDPSMKFQCSRCIRGFKTQGQLQQHILRHDSRNESEAWFCLACKGGEDGAIVSFEHIEDLKKHHLAEHRNTSLVCPVCDQVFKGYLVSKYNHHVKEHSSPTEYECVACGDRFGKKYSLRFHLQQMGPYHNGQCTACKKKFDSWPEHRDHVRKEHAGVFKQVCGRCGQEFKSAAQAQIHRRHCNPKVEETSQNSDAETDQKSSKKREEAKKSNQERTVPMCEACGKTFANVHNFIKHNEDNHGPDQLQCSKCSKVLLHPNSLERHMKRFHEEFPCEHCGATMTAGKYPSHVFTHHTPDDLKPYICNVCTKGFGTKKSFDDHMNIHSGRRPHCCKICPATFNSAGNLYAHIRSLHKGIKRREKRT